MIILDETIRLDWGKGEVRLAFVYRSGRHFFYIRLTARGSSATLAWHPLVIVSFGRAGYREPYFLLTGF